MSELWQRSALELAEAIARREVSSVEVVQAHLDRIESERAAAGAARSDAGYKVEEVTPPLVPTGLVDDLPTGVQVVGPRFREDLCLAGAEAIEAALGTITPIDPR